MAKLNADKIRILKDAVKSAAAIASTAGMDFPGLSVRLRHREFGWQVVSVASPRNQAAIVNDFIYFNKKFPDCMMYVAAISGEQSWSCFFNWIPDEAR